MKELGTIGKPLLTTEESSTFINKIANSVGIIYVTSTEGEKIAISAKKATKIVVWGENGTGTIPIQETKEEMQEIIEGMKKSSGKKQ